MDPRQFEQRLIEKIADEIAEVATERLEAALASGSGHRFDVGDGVWVNLITVDHYDVGGMLLTVETEDSRRYLVRLEIQSGHYAFEAVPLDEYE